MYISKRTKELATLSSRQPFELSEYFVTFGVNSFYEFLDHSSTQCRAVNAGIINHA